MYLDGILTNSHVDSSGESLDTKGVDLTDFYEGKAIINWEHDSKVAENVIGAVVYCKRIMKKSECENKRQEMYYEQVDGPYIYIIGELMDDEEHPGAVACAAMVRYYQKRREKMFIGWSIEGQTLERDGGDLKRAVARKVAFTLRPCLKSATMGVPELADVEKLLGTTKKSEAELYQIDADQLELSEDQMPDATHAFRKAIEDLNKTLTASGGNVAPSQLVGGPALSRESVSSKTANVSGMVKARLKAALRDWDRRRPLKETIKAALPEVSDEYLDHFTDLAQDLALKKNLPLPQLYRIGSQHGHQAHDDDQKKLIEGLYMDPAKEFNPNHSDYSPDNKKLYKLKNDAGQDVIVKVPGGQSHFPLGPQDMHHAMAYHKIAKDYFGMGDNVPVTSTIKHPKLGGGAESQAIEFVPGMTPYESQEAWKNKFEENSNKGQIHKLLAMDQILGVADRHLANIIMGKDGHIKHIDNDSAFSYPMGLPHEYAENSDIIHPEAVKWLMSKDPVQLVQHMKQAGLQPDQIRKSVAALRAWQQMATKGKSAKVIHDNVQGLLTSMREAK